MDRHSLRDWVGGYERAWRTPDGPELDRALAELFAAGATYLTAPFERPFEGLPAITQMWKAGRQGPDEPFTMAAEIIAADPQQRVGVVRVEVRYGAPPGLVYRDLWILHFDAADKCAAFEEWPFWPPGSRGSYQRGPELPHTEEKIPSASEQAAEGVHLGHVAQ
ncbi:MAG: hypothetical protein HY901_25815, partial [Deltaproteobacteria bacterium]|nr:hypothetical protein [Deltaproteobacteria bacterium]